MAAYHGDLDSTGHRYGVSSQAWEFQLSHVDRLAEQLASALPSGTALYVTADHGMVNVGPDDKIDVDADGPAAVLRDGVALLGGEPRARHVYAAPGAAADVLATWREVLGEHAWVASREEAVKDGWFGPPGVVDEAMAARIGDVVAACVGHLGRDRVQGRAAAVLAVRHARLADRGRAAGPDAHDRRPRLGRRIPSPRDPGRAFSVLS